MADSATDIVSPVMFKEHLRLSVFDSSMDSSLKRAINSGVAYVQQATGLPLIDVTETLPATALAADAGIRVRGAGLRSTVSLTGTTRTGRRQLPRGRMGASSSASSSWTGCCTRWAIGLPAT